MQESMKLQRADPKKLQCNIMVLSMFDSHGGFFFSFFTSKASWVSYHQPLGGNSVIMPTAKCLSLSCVSPLKPSVLEVLLAADLQGFRHTDGVDAALGLQWSRTDSTPGRSDVEKGKTQSTSAALSRSIIYSLLLLRLFSRSRWFLWTFALTCFNNCATLLQQNNDVGLEKEGRCLPCARKEALVTQVINGHGCSGAKRVFEVPFLFYQLRQWVL